MDLWQTFVLALVQGLTEFLPISSSGHLVITRELLHWKDAGVAFDAFTGFGTMTAVIVYFHHDLWQIGNYWRRQFLKKGEPDPKGYAKLGNLLILATIPAAIIGFLLKDFIDNYFHHPLVIAGTTLGYGIILGVADKYGHKQKPLSQIGLKDTLIYGFSQALALIPGTSRSGITITTGLAMGYTREAAARFSFLMSIPISGIAGAYGLYKMCISSNIEFNWQIILFAYVVSTFSAYLCIHLFLQFLNKFGMMPHVIYRLILGAVLLFVFI